jgi:gamma-glutamyltranspeptidase/glutathione hydrolase
MTHRALTRSAALVVFISLSGAVGALAAEPSRAVFHPGGWGGDGMVVSDSRLASEAGAAVIERGGNAVDAAVTAAFALTVTYPWAGNLAGGGFAVLCPADGAVTSLDFRETAPAAARPDMFLDARGEIVPGLSLNSHLAAGVPGSVDGLLRLWEDHGSGHVTQAELLAPAIRLAREGFAIDQDLAERLNRKRARLREDEGAAAIFVRADGRDWHPGDVLVQEDLARTLERIAAAGRDGFYNGKTAELIVREMMSGNGAIVLDDLAAYRAVYREPVRGTFRGYEIVGMGPPSSGGVFVAQILNMLEARPLEEYGWGSADYIHTVAEAERRAFADRSRHLGDPDFWTVPLAMLLDKGYARERMQSVSLHLVTPSRDMQPGDAASWEPTETTHLCAADADGNVVSLTTTLNAGFGSCLVVDGTGVLLNNEMDDFAVKPGVPNLYGLVGDSANAVASGKRMLSSMSPTIVLRDGKAVLALGAAGGSRIITSVTQVILNVLVFGMPVSDAVAAPRFHHQWLPDELWVEPLALAPEVARALTGRGHHVKLRGDEPLANVNAIAITKDGFFGGPETRNAAYAAGAWKRR